MNQPDIRPTDVSIDIESLGKRYGAAVLSIGAAAFNRHTGKYGPVYSARIDLEDAMSFGHLDPNTLLWWMQQSEAARASVFAPGGMHSTQALQGLNSYFNALPANVCVWGNGASFDMTLLEALYEVTGIECPWNNERVFWTVRDLCTLVDLANLDKKTILFNGTPHCALDDAVHQAEIAVACFQKLRVGAPVQVKEEEAW